MQRYNLPDLDGLRIQKSQIVETAAWRSVGTAPPAPMRQGTTKGEKDMMNLEEFLEIKEKAETQKEKENRIFNHYKNRLKKESSEKIRFICIEYLCSFPKIDPFVMAAAIVRDGYKILFDDSSISIKENKIKERKLEKLLKTS